MIRLLDANIVVAILADDERILNRIADLDQGSLLIPSVAYAEVWFGIERNEAGRDAAMATLAALTRHVPVVPFDAAAGRAYARVPFRRHRFDRLIAAHALALGATIATRNPEDFADVPGLAVEEWR